MGLFNHLFGSRSDLAKEIHFDADERMSLWNEHLANYSKREELSKFFSFKNIDKAMSSPEQILVVLSKIASLISRDLVEIEEEEKSEEEVLGDIVKLSRSLLDPVNPSVVKRQESVYSELKRLYEVLLAELHLIKMLMKSLNRDLLLKLFSLIFHVEGLLLKKFENLNHPARKDLQRLVRAVLLEEKLTEEMQSAEEKFVRNAIQKIGRGTSHKYGRLAERIRDAILELSGVPLNRDDDSALDETIEKIESSFQNRKLLRELIIRKKGNLKLTEQEIDWMVSALIEAYSNLDLLDVDLYA